MGLNYISTIKQKTVPINQDHIERNNEIEMSNNITTEIKRYVGDIPAKNERNNKRRVNM